MASLRIEGEGGPEEYALETLVVVLGRSLQSDVRIKDIKASRRHCQVVKDADGYRIVDLESGNGTWLNGVKIKEMKLNSGDRIQIGGTVVTFNDAPAKAEAPAPVEAPAPPPPPPPPPKKPAPVPVPPTERAELVATEADTSDDSQPTEAVPIHSESEPELVKPAPPAPSKAEGPAPRPPKRATTRQMKNRPPAASRPAAGKKMNPLIIVAIVAGILVLAVIAFFATRGDKGGVKHKSGKGSPAVVGRR